MPYLHWERSLATAHVRSIVNDVKRLRLEPVGTERLPPSPDEIYKLDCSTDEKLLRRYLYANQPLHARRTLDAFFHTTLTDTTTRDQDQVVDRFVRDKLPFSLDGPPMLMVDQCWLWILNGSELNMALARRFSG